MAAKFSVKIIAKDGIKFNGTVESLTVPSLTGEVTILANHIPILSGLKKGRVLITPEDATPQNFDITSGFLRFINNTCIVTIEETKLQKAS